jgi:hypothetical protein
MKTVLTTQARIENGRLQVDMPTELPPGVMDVEIHVESRNPSTGADLVARLKHAGKLQMEGDPMEIAREMRRAWCE